MGCKSTIKCRILQHFVGKSEIFCISVVCVGEKDYLCACEQEKAMPLRNTLYRIGAYVRYFFTSWNTRGEGIHSPYLFHIVDSLMYEQNAYYCFAAIERRRAAMLQSGQVLSVVDYGTGAADGRKNYTRRVSDIALSSLESPRMGQLLFRIALFLGQEARRPLEIVELGTSLGITTAYLAAACSRNKVTTFEGSSAVAGMARQNWQTLGLANITHIEGNIDETLREYVREQVDMVYIDANHTEEATVRYFEHFLPMAGEKSVFIIDDIHHSPEMQRAWQTICDCPQVTSTMDIWNAGIVFFDPHYIRCHYTLRI